MNMEEAKNNSPAEPVLFTKVLDVPIEKVWSALTNKEEMKQWYFDLADFQPKVGFEFQFLGGKEGREYRHLCKVTEVELGRKISYSWRYEGFPGSSLVTFELSPEGNKTTITLTHRGLETFGGIHPDLDVRNFIEGWTYIIGTALPNFLKTNTPQ